jgi:ABC-2 type transport system ATP-binding protein
MIEARGLTKRFGETLAVDGLTFSIRPGEVTGFLGRNGAGKTTTLRMILGLERPTSGTVAIDGCPYAELASPLRHVGALLDARAVHPDRTAVEHLLSLATSNGIQRRRVSEVLQEVGLANVSRKPVGGFSLGMLQRLGLAAALLGDPPTLVLDEPLNGLDPEGIIWFRHLMREMAQEGRSILVSSHLMTEMALTADHLLIIGDGRLLADSEMRAFVAEHEHEQIRVRTSDSQALQRCIRQAGGTTEHSDGGSFLVTGLAPATIGALALAAGVEIHELTTVRRSLEEVFMELTSNRVPQAAIRAAAPTPHGPQARAIQEEPAQPAARTACRRSRIARFADAVRSELLKLTSTRSGPLIAAGSAVAGIGLAALTSNFDAEHYAELTAEKRRSFDPTAISLRSRILAQVLIGTLGALCMTSEYGTGTITPSLIAVPDRTRLLAAKATTAAGTSLITGLATTIGGFAVGQALLARHGAPHDTLASPASLRAVCGGGLYLTTASLLGLGTGTITRDTASAVGALVGLTIIAPAAIIPLLPEPLPAHLLKYWPTEAGARILTTHPDPDLLGPWAGLAVMAGTAGVALTAGRAAFRRRDI